jgi:hypothetical protein
MYTQNSNSVAFACFVVVVACRSLPQLILRATLHTASYSRQQDKCKSHPLPHRKSISFAFFLPRGRGPPPPAGPQASTKKTKTK